MKTFYQLFNIGTAKYVINFHNGKKLHKDGSKFYDIEIFKNKKDNNQFIDSLKKQGYVHGLPF